MHSRYAVFALALLAGCSTHPVTFMSLTPLQPDTALACATRQVKALGYVVTKDTTARQIVGEKTRRSSSLLMFGSKADIDQLKVVIAETDSARQMQVVAGTGRRQSNLLGVLQTRRPPGKQVKADADAVLSACKKEARGAAAYPPSPAAELQSTLRVL